MLITRIEPTKFAIFIVFVKLPEMQFFLISFFFHVILFDFVSYSSDSREQPMNNVELYHTGKVTFKKTTAARPIERFVTKLKTSDHSSLEKNTNAQPEFATFKDLSDLDNQQGSDVYSYLVGLIYNNRIYPFESVRLKQQGLVKLSFRINQDGELIDIKFLEASPHLLLNRAAMQTLKKINIDKSQPDVASLYNRNYSFTFEFLVKKST